MLFHDARIPDIYTPTNSVGEIHDAFVESQI